MKGGQAFETYNIEWWFFLPLGNADLSSFNSYGSKFDERVGVISLHLFG
jgi:hypothetical protein